jgi:transposase
MLMSFIRPIAYSLVMRRPVPLTISEAEEEGLRKLMAEGDKGEYRRSLAIILRTKGAPSHAIAGMLGVTRRSVDRWIEAYRSGGIEGLKRKPRSGRKPRITEDQKKTIAEAALKSPRAFGYLRNEWSIREGSWQGT